MPTLLKRLLTVALLLLPVCAGSHERRLVPALASPSPSPMPSPLNCLASTAEASSADDDLDGIVDACEQLLGEKFAPIIYHSSDESNFPTNVDLFLRKTALWFYDDACTPDLKIKLIANPSQAQLLGQSHQGGCGSSDTVISNGTRSDRKQRTFFLEDVENGLRVGSLDSAEWTTYYHAYKNDLGGVTIQYWRFYAFNDAFNDHGGDWEGLHVVLNSSLAVSRFDLLGHTAIESVQPANITSEGNHPRIFSEGGGHASRASGNGIEAQGCPGNISCTIDLTNPRTFVRQETWPGGQVKWFDGKVSKTGPLLNLGEKLHPLNNQIFIQYSGIWGSPGTFFGTSGYWGPAFNETDMGNNGFIKAWCSGMTSSTQDRECFPTARSR